MRQHSPIYGSTPRRRRGPAERPEQVGHDGQPYQLLPETEAAHRNHDDEEPDDDY